MKFFNTVILSIIILMATGCSVAPKPEELQIYIKKPNTMKPYELEYFMTPIIFDDTNYITFRTKRTGEGKISWLGKTTHFGNSWMFINKLYFNLDGSIYEFDSKHEKREVSNSGRIEENNLFLFTPEFMDKIANSKSIIIRLSGDNYYTESDISSFSLPIRGYIINVSSNLTMNIAEWCSMNESGHYFCKEKP